LDLQTQGLWSVRQAVRVVSEEGKLLTVGRETPYRNPGNQLSFRRRLHPPSVLDRTTDIKSEIPQIGVLTLQMINKLLKDDKAKEFYTILSS
jgi:hypothetical protein